MVQTIFGRGRRARPDTATQAEQVKEEVRRRVLEEAAAPYERALEELEELHEQFREDIAKRRETVDAIRAAEERIVALEQDRAALRDRHTDVSLDEDEPGLKRLRGRNKEFRKEIESVRKERDKARARLEKFPDELTMAAELKEAAERIATHFGHDYGMFLSTAVSALERQKAVAVTEAARNAAEEHRARGAEGEGLTATLDNRPRVAREHRHYLDPPAGLERLVPVRFLKSNSPYAEGEVAAFPLREARQLRARGQAELLEDVPEEVAG